MNSSSEDDPSRAPRTVPSGSFKEPSQHAREAYLSEPKFDQDEGLSEEDKALADSFPASDPPAH
jgi:hypothetical protein